MQINLRVLVLTLSLFFTTYINAQDATNTDTWEETMEYIKNNSQCYDYAGCEGVKFEGDLYYYYNGLFGVDKYEVSDFTTIKEVQGSGIWIELTFEGETKIAYSVENDEILSKSDIQSIPNLDGDMRLLKSYQHLLYLLKKKRNN